MYPKDFFGTNHELLSEALRERLSPSSTQLYTLQLEKVGLAQCDKTQCTMYWCVVAYFLAHRRIGNSLASAMNALKNAFGEAQDNPLLKYRVFYVAGLCFLNRGEAYIALMWFKKASMLKVRLASDADDLDMLIAVAKRAHDELGKMIPRQRVPLSA